MSDIKTDEPEEGTEQEQEREQEGDEQKRQSDVTKPDGVGEDSNYEEEYEKFREQSGGGLTLLEQIRHVLDDQIGLFKDTTLDELFEHKEQLDAIKTEVVKAKKMLRGTEKFVTDDMTSSLAALRQCLSTYSAAIYEKLKHESNEDGSDRREKSSDDSRTVTEAQQTFARISVELKELELFVAQIEQSASLLVGGDVIEKTEDAERQLEAADTEDQQNKETEEDRRVREEQEREEKEAEERRAREAEEERVRQEEENQRLKEEEERRKQEEEERLKKEDPRHWPAIVYDLEDDEDVLGSNVACVVRAPPEGVSLQRQDLGCHVVSWRDNRYNLDENEEVVSAMVCVKPTNETPLEFESAVWLAIPYFSTSRTRETTIKIQEVRKPAEPEKQDEEKQETETEVRSATPAPSSPTPAAEWLDVLTRDTTVEGQEATKFVETAIKHLGANGINIIVLTRPKRDVDKWNNKGGRLVSSVDQRVTVSAPKNAFRLTTDVTLQVTVIDSAAMSGLKERYDGCDNLLGTSPLVSITTSNKPLKPLLVTLSNPSGGGKKSKQDANNKPTTNNLPRTFGAKKDQGDSSEDTIHLLVKDSVGKWRHRDKVKLEQERENVTFQLNELTQRLILLRAKASVDSAELCRMVTSLETSLTERPAQLVVRQHAVDPTLVYLECCRRDIVDKLVSGRLTAAQFTDGPEPSRVFVLREGDLVEVSFRDNIDSVEKCDGGRQFVFNSNLSTVRMQLSITEVNQFAQNALDVYRGFVRLSLVDRLYQPPPKMAAISTSGGKKLQAGSGSKQSANDCRSLLCEVLVTLPKPPKEVMQIKRIDVPITGADPLSSEYFDRLSADIGEDWMKLAEKLRLNRPAIQRIARAYSHLDSPIESAQKSARDALNQWFRSSAKSNNKVEELRLVLVDAGRNDLAEELNNKNKQYRSETDKKVEETRLQKSVKVFLDNLPAVKAWREVGKGLGLSQEDLEVIGGPAPTTKARAVSGKEARELAERMMNKWREMDKATSSELLSVVKKLKLNDVAASITMMIS